MDRQQLVSVIIPVYNVKDFLVKCLESVCGQTYKNMEIFLVDDGSTDGCGAICDAYAKKDSRVKVIHQVNSGLSEARNAALDCCKGEWVSFIDSDDYVAKDYIETLYDACISSDADIGVCGRYDVFPSAMEERFQMPGPCAWTVKEALRNLLLSQGVHIGAWGKLYKANLFDGIRYPAGELSEDVAVFLPILRKVRRISHTGKSSYYYVHREGSISAGMSARQRTAFFNYKKFYQEILAEHKELKKEAASYYVSALLYFLNLCHCGRISKKKNQEYKNFYQLIFRECRKMALLGFFNPYVTLREKSALLLHLTKCFGTAKRILECVRRR